MRGRIHVTNGAQPSELVKIADKILSPISATDNTYGDLVIHDNYILLV